MKLRLFLLAAALLACGRIAQSPVCATYLECAIAIDPSTTRQVNGQYGHLGTCWATNQATADACTVQCATELERLRADGGMDVAQCQ